MVFEFVVVLKGDPHDIQRLPDTFADFVAGDELGSLHLQEAACGCCRWIADVIYDAHDKMYIHIGWEKFARNTTSKPASCSCSPTLATGT